MKNTVKTPERGMPAAEPLPARGTWASTDIVGAFLAKYGQITDGPRTDMNLAYKSAELKKTSGDWYVEYQYLVPPEFRKYGEVYRRFRVRKEINRVLKKKGESAAEAYGKDLVNIVNLMLREGFNPFLSQIVRAVENKIETDLKEEKAKDINLNTALNIYLEEKKGTNLSARTLTDYESYMGMFKEYMASRGLLKASLFEIETTHIEDYLKGTAALRGWKSATYNTHRDFISGVFNELIRWSRKDKKRPKIIDNPVHGVDSQISKPTNHKYYTAEYSRRVKEFMKKKDPFVFDLCQFIYYSCTRPKAETRLIKIEHIDLERRVLRVPKGKTGYRYVPICQELAEWLDRKNIYQYPGEYYLFGKNGEVSPYPAGINYLTNRYKAIKDDFGIPVEYTLYGWKHTRCVDLIASGLSTIEAMQVTGHDDVDSFEKYLRDMGVAMSGKVTGKTVRF